MTLVEFTLHDERKVLINPALVAYLLPIGGNSSIQLTRLIMVSGVEPVDVRESVPFVSKTLQNRI